MYCTNATKSKVSPPKKGRGKQHVTRKHCLNTKNVYKYESYARVRERERQDIGYISPIFSRERKKEGGRCVHYIIS